MAIYGLERVRLLAGAGPGIRPAFLDSLNPAVAPCPVVFDDGLDPVVLATFVQVLTA